MMLKIILKQSIVRVLLWSFLISLIPATAVLGQVYTPLVYLNKNTSYNPTTSLVQGIDGNLFGTTEHVLLLLEKLLRPMVSGALEH